jgi:hypothetical protein
MNHKCPTCGHTPTTKKRAAVDPIVDVDALSDIGLRAYRTKTAPYYDIHFFLSCDRVMSAELKASALELAATVDANGKFSGMTRSNFYKAYAELARRKRIEANAAHWIELLLTRKADAWRDAREADAFAIELSIEVQADLLLASVEAA